VLLLALAWVMAGGAGCASSANRPSGYFQRDSIHRDSFPAGYTPGRHHRVGRPHGL
jgi:hypothetical protein